MILSKQMCFKAVSSPDSLAAKVRLASLKKVNLPLLDRLFGHFRLLTVISLAVCPTRSEASAARAGGGGDGRLYL